MEQTGFLFKVNEGPGFPRERLARKLSELAAQGIAIGASSWKYEGWLGQIYTWERYAGRRGFSRKRFEESCLEEYAETFPIVCGDFSFYQFPSPAYWSKLFGSAPRDLLYAFKAPEEITVKAWPGHPRYGPHAGLENPSFLSAETFQRCFLDELAPYQRQISLIILEFGTFAKSVFPDAEPFLKMLAVFLKELPRDFRYAVEIRNPEYVGPEYFACLKECGVTHVFNSWTRMPHLAAQLEMPGALNSDFLVSRALLKPGRSYGEAVERFAPYREIQHPLPEVRQALRDMVAIAKREKRLAFLFVNNRLEGNAPATILSIVEE